MRFYPPIYPEDSVQHPASFPGGDATDAFKTALFPTFFVRRTMREKDTPAPRADAGAAAQQKYAMGGAWVGSKLKSYYEALVRKFERAGQAEMENYLAASQNLADLEERIRRYERLHSRYY